MLITTEWSEPKSVKYGYSIKILSSRGDIHIKLSSNNPAFLEKSKYLHTDAKETIFNAEEISELTTPWIQFKTQAGEAHVEYELF